MNSNSPSSGGAARSLFSSTTSSQSWEFSKENIQPIRSGRNVAVIDRVLQSTPELLITQQQ